MNYITTLCVAATMIWATAGASASAVGGLMVHGQPDSLAQSTAADIASRIRKAAGKALESLTLFDVYTGEHMAPGKKSLAYSLVLRAADRTLTDEEAENAVKKVLANLAEISVELRS